MTRAEIKLLTEAQGDAPVYGFTDLSLAFNQGLLRHVRASSDFVRPMVPGHHQTNTGIDAGDGGPLVVHSNKLPATWPVSADSGAHVASEECRSRQAIFTRDFQPSFQLQRALSSLIHWSRQSRKRLPDYSPALEPSGLIGPISRTLIFAADTNSS